MVSNKNVLISGYLMLFSGILHLIVTVLASGILELLVTALIFGIFLLFISIILIKRIRNNQLDETRRVIIWNITVSLLNCITILTHLLRKTPEERIIVYIFLILIIIIDLICFIIFFIKKTKLDKMDSREKLSFFSIIVIKGLGIGLLVNVLAWIGLTNDLNPFMITYILIFGTLNTIYGEVLYRRKEDKKIQTRALIVLILGLIFETILCLFFTNAKSIADIILYLLIIPIRFYYIRSKF